MKLVPAAAERLYYGTVRPAVNVLVRSGIRPNTITSVGTAVVIASAVCYALGQVRWGGALLLLSGVADTLDGQVARAGNLATKFGAFYDSTLDRVGDGATFIGIAIYLLSTPGVAWREPAVLACMLGVLSSLLVSYARARAEGIGVDCRVGIAQRAERIVGLGVPSLLVGAGPSGVVLEVIVGALTLASIITVVQRFVYVYRQTEGARAG
ncbi:MAG TPA: CDP-alcohol phosphatidyltransferase family protein [Gemmatimonadales bacterium]|nr:CDP-alcohol phosphatidyltransferase family protein [Gemmatimonadales bacterium]